MVSTLFPSLCCDVIRRYTSFCGLNTSRVGQVWCNNNRTAEMVDLCLLLQAQCLFAQDWNNPVCPPLSHWFKELLSTWALEKEKKTYLTFMKLGIVYEFC